MNYESRMWERIRDTVRSVGVATRIESGGLVSGIPDIAYAVRGQSGWIECKSIANPPKRANHSFDIGSLTEVQKKWHLRWSQHTHTFIYIEVRNPGVHIFIPGRLAGMFGVYPYGRFLEVASCWFGGAFQRQTVLDLLIAESPPVSN